MALGVLARLAAAGDQAHACAIVADHLAANPDYKPSVYLERGGRLRCVAARTYLQVFDGMPTGAGMIGRTFVSGETGLVADVRAYGPYLEISPGVVAEICAPVRAGGEVVGVVSVESFSVLDAEDVRTVEACAEALGDRLGALGGGLQETPAQRLVRHATRLTDTKSRRRIEREVLEAAADVAGMTTAALLAPDGDEVVGVLDAVGPLGLEIGALPQDALATIARFVDGGTSCFTVGQAGGHDFSGLAQLRDAGAAAIAMLELSVVPKRVLVVADGASQEIATETIELLELLCAQAASALRVSDLVRDLRVQAATDPLTGLGHHRAFHARLNAPTAGRRTAVLIIDLDRFKAINDSEGHVAGDRLLREVAAVMQAAVRDGDEIFRIGGDEFAVLTDAVDSAEAAEIAERIVEASGSGRRRPSRSASACPRSTSGSTRPCCGPTARSTPPNAPAATAWRWRPRSLGAVPRRRFLSSLARGGDIAIDLGTANTVVFVRGRGIVMSEPSVVAIDQRTGEVHAVGADAQQMIGRTPASISADRPLRHGVIADFEVTEAMLRSFMSKVMGGRFNRPRVVVCAPSGITEVERRAVEEASLSAGARHVELIEESLAAAIGAGLEIAEPIGRMVVDVGGGTSEVAIISLGGLVVSRSQKVGGYDLDDAITNYLRTEHRMAVGTQTAEEIKLQIGSALQVGEERSTRVRGRDLQLRPPAGGHADLRRGARRAGAARRRDARRRPLRPGGVPARAGRRHHPPRHRPHRAAARCSRASPSASTWRRAWRSPSPRTRCCASPSAPGRPSRNSTACAEGSGPGTGHVSAAGT